MTINMLLLFFFILSILMSYLCPLCHTPLQLQQQSLACSNKHQFDIAKEGYVNLLPVQHKASKDPGDNKEMMQARRAFLEQGYYLPLRNKINALLNQYLDETEHTKVLDLGCGEGYYTQSFVQTNRQIYGLDISKAMIRAASKSHKDCHFVVASSQRLPFANNSLNAIIRIYAPCEEQELKRVLKPNGIILTVTPAARHLYQLKALIYSSVRLHEDNPESLADLQMIAQERLSYEMKLVNENAARLLQMTPFAWRASEKTKQELLQMNEFNCEADFMLRIYQKSE